MASAQPAGRPLYQLGDDDFPHVAELDHVERNRYLGLRRVGMPPQDALAKAREVEDPLPELDELEPAPLCGECFGTGRVPFSAATCPKCKGRKLER